MVSISAPAAKVEEEEVSGAVVAVRSVRGRRFAAGVPYVLPKDMQEVNRLDFQH